MRRYFLTVAVAAGSMLVASLGLGLCALRKPMGGWGGSHWWFAVLTTVAVLGVHASVLVYFLRTRAWAAAVVRSGNFPAWIVDHSEKNQRKALRFEFWSTILIATASGLGVLSVAYGWNSNGHALVAAAATSFNLGAFVVEFATIASQSRLIMEIRAQASRRQQARPADLHQVTVATAGENDR